MNGGHLEHEAVATVRSSRTALLRRLRPPRPGTPEIRDDKSTLGPAQEPNVYSGTYHGAISTLELRTSSSVDLAPHPPRPRGTAARPGRPGPARPGRRSPAHLRVPAVNAADPRHLI